MNKGIRMNCVGLKCDNKGCDFVDNTISFEDYPNWINKPCPKCGENLLTEQDYYTVKTMFDIANLINDSLPEELEKENPDEIAKLTVNLNGTGKIGLDLSIENNIEKH